MAANELPDSFRAMELHATGSSHHRKDTGGQAKYSKMFKFWIHLAIDFIDFIDRTAPAFEVPTRPLESRADSLKMVSIEFQWESETTLSGGDISESEAFLI